MAGSGRLRGTRGNDGLAARWDGDRVYGLTGHDRIASLFNETVLFGGRGNDRLTAELPSVSDYEDPARSVEIHGGRGNDRIIVRRSYDDAPTWPGGDSTTYRHLLDGGAGRDVITLKASSMSGFDDVEATIDGGGGRDTIAVSVNTRDLPRDIWSTMVSVEVDGGNGNDDLTLGALSGGDPFGGYLSAQLRGGDGNDSIRASAEVYSEGGEVETWFDGGDGDDWITAELSVATDSGGGYEMWTTASHQVDGGSGNDVIRVTVLHGGDTGEVGVRVSGGQGDDDIEVAMDFLDGAMIDVLVDGGSGADVLAVVLRGPASTLSVRGGSGDDVLTVDMAPSEYYSSASGSASLAGGSGSDTLKVVGGEGNLLDGGSGADVLIGGDGADTLVGGSSDEMTGGGGADRFVLYHYDGNDRITDFDRRGDVLVFRGVEDRGEDGILDDLNVESISDTGPGGDVIVQFGWNSLVLVGAGTGSVDSLEDLVDDPASQIVAETLV